MCGDICAGSLGVVLYRMANSVNVAVAKGASSVEQRNKEMLDKKKRVDGEVNLLNSKEPPQTPQRQPHSHESQHTRPAGPCVGVGFIAFGLRG